jgi:formylglycine-generating enzyme required for sulfatase activity
LYAGWGLKLVLTRPVLPAPLAIATLLFAFAICTSLPGAKSDEESYVTKSGVKMILVRHGKFLMGNDLATDPAKLLQPNMLLDGDYDEKPVHEVTISHDYYMSETEITWLQFEHTSGWIGRTPDPIRLMRPA